MGIYFLPESFDPATIQARLLFEPQRLSTVRLFYAIQSVICNIKCEQHGCSKLEVHVAQLKNKASLEDTMCTRLSGVQSLEKNY